MSSSSSSSSSGKVTAAGASSSWDGNGHERCLHAALWPSNPDETGTYGWGTTVPGGRLQMAAGHLREDAAGGVFLHAGERAPSRYLPCAAFFPGLTSFCLARYVPPGTGCNSAEDQGDHSFDPSGVDPWFVHHTPHITPTGT